MAESDPQDPAFAALDDTLFCQEKNWEDDDEVSHYSNNNYNNYDNNNDSNNTSNYNDFEIFNNCNESNVGPAPVCSSFSSSSSQLVLSEQDLNWEDEELSALLTKEKGNAICKNLQSDPSLGLARGQAVDWMLKVHAHYTFSLQTALLAVNYFDRFMVNFEFQRERHWMTQLASVACLSLAAKVEETHVPLLLDFQVEDSKYVFEAKTIQRMELLVLSTLQWKMNPVTPTAFLDYLIRRLHLKDFHLCWEFLRRCERVLLSTIPDVRFTCYLPSAIAAATILHVVNGLEPCIVEEYKNQVLCILGIDKEKVEDCCELIVELAAGGRVLQSNKRKSVFIPASPNRVIDVSFSSDSSNDSWAVTSSVSSSPLLSSKKMKTSDEELHLERFNHPSVDFLSIPR